MLRLFYKSVHYYILASSFFISTISCFAQKHPFESPLDIPIYLSGSFGDLRLNHFHTGFDIRTQSQIGKFVYAANDGFISRIKIEPSGYGKAIYIEHPNGYTSVYAHLDGFAETIAQVIKNQQYQQSSFAVDFTPTIKIKVKKGELIGFSGNSGGSGGPHLHFEIRKTKSQNPINPFQFNFDLKDDFSNKFDDLYIYPLYGETINNKTTPLKFDIKPLAGQKWSIKVKKPIEIDGPVGIGIDAGCKSRSGFSHGLTRIEMTVNGRIIYSLKLDEFSYSETRYANSASDYSERLHTGKRIYKLYIDQCNALDNIHSFENGIIKLTDTLSIARIKIITTDFRGTKAELSFSIHSKKAFTKIKTSKRHSNINKYRDLISCKDNFSLENDSFKIFISKGSVYDSIPAKYSVRPAISNTITPIYTFNNEYIPIHSSINVKIKIPQNIDSLRNKIIMVNVWEKGILTSLSSNCNANWVEASSRTFGDFALAIDTVAPQIKPVTLASKTDMSFVDLLVFTIQDNLSGINTINGYIDGRWVLFEYDPKTRRIYYQFDPIRLTYGKIHQLKINVSDKCDNTTNYITEFYK